MTNETQVLTPSQYFRGVTGHELPLHTFQEMQDCLFLLDLPETDGVVIQTPEAESTSFVVVGFLNEKAMLEYRLMPSVLKNKNKGEKLC